MNQPGRCMGGFFVLITEIQVEICILTESVQPLEADIVLVSSSKLRPYVILHFVACLAQL